MRHDKISRFFKRQRIWIQRLMEIYQKRWRIEECHKSIKQNASLEKSLTKVVHTQKTHIFTSTAAYCKLEILRVKTRLNQFSFAS